MARQVQGKNGRTVTLLNPSEKGRKYADELSNGVKLTNDEHLKMDKFNRPIPLSDTEKAWRSGYLAARKDSASCWKAQQKKK